MKRNTMMLTLVAGLLLCGSQAFGLVLLAEDFNDVTGIGTTQRTIQSILATSPGELPSGTTWTVTPAATAASLNVRHTNHQINTNVGSPANFNGFFTPIDSVNNILVLGDDSGAINREALSGISMVTIPFVIPIGTTSIHITFDYAFNGWNSTTTPDEFKVFITDGTTSVNLIDFFSTNRVLPTTKPPNYAAGSFDGGLVTSLFASNLLSIKFVLNEGTVANLTLKDTAAGIDNIVIDTVPEPSTFLLFGAGLGGLALLRRKRS